MILERFPTYSPHDFVFKIAKTPEDLDHGGFLQTIKSFKTSI